MRRLLPPPTRRRGYTGRAAAFCAETIEAGRIVPLGACDNWDETTAQCLGHPVAVQRRQRRVRRAAA